MSKFICKTIGRNRKKKIEEIFGSVDKVTSFSLDTCFKGVECSIESAKRHHSQLNFAKLQFRGVTEEGKAKYDLHVTMRQWYTFTSPVQP